MVRRVLNPCLKDQSLGDLALFQRIREQLLKESKSLGDKDVVLSIAAGRIHECAEHAHRLRDLYRRVTNRQELTKVIVGRLLHSGGFVFGRNQPDDSSSCYTLYAQSLDAGGTNTMYDMERLQDLKLRSLLRVNSSQKTKRGDDEEGEADAVVRQTLQVFLTVVDLAMDVLEKIINLERLGHFGYRDYNMRIPIDVEVAKGLLTELEDEMKAWKEELSALRAEHYDLNFFLSQQLWMMADFFQGVHARDSRVTASHASLVRSASRAVDTGRLLDHWHGCLQTPGDGRKPSNPDLNQWGLIGVFSLTIAWRSSEASPVPSQGCSMTLDRSRRLALFVVRKSGMMVCLLPPTAVKESSFPPSMPCMIRCLRSVHCVGSGCLFVMRLLGKKR